MDINYYSLTQVKITKILFFAFLTLLFSQHSKAQCTITNPDPTGPALQSFCEIDNNRVSDLTANGTLIAWFDAAIGGNQIDNSTLLKDGTIYYADDIAGGGCSANRLAVTVNIDGQIPDNVDVFVGKCAIENPTISDLSADGTNIEWYDAQTNGNLLIPSTPLADGQTYWVQQTENGCTSSRVPTTVSLIDPPTPTIGAIQTFCPTGSLTIADLTADVSNVLWYDTETSTTPLPLSTPLIHGEDYWVTQIIFPCESVVRAQTIVQIDTIPNAGNDASLTECELNFTVTDLFSLLGPSAETTGVWSGPSTLSNDHLGTFDPSINLEGTYTYTVASNLGVCPSASASVTITITEVPPPTTAETTQTFCEIENATIANLTVSGDGILWYDTESSTSPLDPTSLLIDGEDYWASQTDASGCESATRLAVTVSIIVVPPPSISSSSQEFCEIDNPTIANLSPNSADIFWYADETSTTPLNSTDILIDGEDYWASQTPPSGCESATRAVVTVTIYAPLPPTTTNANQTFCEIENATVADLDASGTGILWYDTETSVTPLNDTDALIDGEDYWATQTPTSNCESATRLLVNVTIIVVPPPTVSETIQTFCEIDNATVANLNASGTSILWYDTETSTTPLNASDLLTDGEDYWASQTPASGCESETRTAVTVQITPVLPPTTTETTQTFCEIENATVADLNASGDNILWYDTEISTTPLNETDTLIDGEDYWASQTPASGCESATRLSVVVDILTPLPPTTTEANQTFCEIDNPTIADLIASGNDILWYDTEFSTTPLLETDLIVNGEDYWASQTPVSGCESASRLVITATILTELPPTISESNQTFCEVDNATIAELLVTGVGIQWYESETSTTPLNSTDLLVDGEDYWASQTTSSGCESATRVVVTVTITTVPPPTTSNLTQTFCAIDYLPGHPTVNDLLVSGTNVNWYASETDNTPLAGTDLLIDGEDYWASETDASGCESANRLVVTVQVIEPSTPTTSNTNQSFCIANNPTIANLDANGENIIWYDTENGTTSLNSSDLLINGEDYWGASSDTTSGCESPNRLQITVTLVQVPAPTLNASNETFCAADQPIISDISVASGNVVWYDTETSTTPLQASEFLVDGEDYWAANTDISVGCESSVRDVVTIRLTDPGTPTIIASGNEFCLIDNPTVNDLNNNVSPNNNGLILWYNSYPNGNLLDMNEYLIDGETYYAVESDSNACVSSQVLEVTVDLNICDEYEVVIYDGFSPNGDGINDTFKIEYLRELYPEFSVEFFNRWGDSVYKGTKDKPDWNGRLKGNGNYVSSGVYYVVINFNKNGKKPVQQSLYLSR